ncbi:putative calmodulin [Trypanosoma rangeli]|uniref:Putative calmodulin n=1 Tax=Trypanosoma rangeli TaxID=5698 RepID=A0A3R7R5F4_TRYRA|nr:putative calmodulin [Trypanosoma rangeli]RNE96299.1 putative calmodulin [Trypanosoma rangeli]|eukprot:RNE96299.1 putative calmodulin [Trypanosoma rangeli]
MSITSAASEPHAESIICFLSPEEVDMLRDAFIYMDRDNDGHVTKEDLLEMVHRCVGDERFSPLKEYLVPLFEVADKDKDKKLSLTEFLLSFADGPGVVPAEVISSCVSSIRVRLTDEEIETLQETFRRIDTKADGFIDKEELTIALKESLKYRFPDLHDNNFNDIVAVIMASADTDRDGRLCLSEFIRSFQEDQGVLPAAFLDAGARKLVQKLTPAEIEVLVEAFAVLDRDHDGYVEAADIYEALWETLFDSTQDKSQIRELCDLIMVTANRKNKGMLTLTDFVQGFVRNITLSQISVAAAQEKMQVACGKLQEMLESGELEQLLVVPDDGNANAACVNPGNLVSVLSNIFRDVFPLLDEEILSIVIGAVVVAADNDSSGKISLENFIHCFAEGPRILSTDSTSSTKSVSLTDDELVVVSQVLHELGKDANNNGCVQEPEVLDALRNVFRGDSKQADRVLQYVRDNIVRHSSTSSLLVEASTNEVEGDESDASDSQLEPVPEPNEAKVETANPAPAPKADTTHETSPNDNMATGLIVTLPSSKQVELFSFGAHATVPSVLVKQHARRYFDSVYDTADTAIFEDELRAEFRKYAGDSQNYIDRDELIKAYLSMEHYGLAPTESGVNQLISRYCTGNKVNYDVFCVLMLRRARM